LHQGYDSLRADGAEVIAVAVASCSSVEQWRKRADIVFPMLADPDHKVSEAYGIYNLFGDNTAGPAVFVIDQDSRVHWSHVGVRPPAYVDAQTVREHLP
jgi:peroxiredoxin Q/BCP